MPRKGCPWDEETCKDAATWSLECLKCDETVLGMKTCALL